MIYIIIYYIIYIDSDIDLLYDSSLPTSPSLAGLERDLLARHSASTADVAGPSMASATTATLPTATASDSAQCRSTTGNSTRVATGKATCLAAAKVQASAWITQSSPLALASASEAASPARSVASKTSTGASEGCRRAEKQEPRPTSRPRTGAEKLNCFDDFRKRNWPFGSI